MSLANYNKVVFTPLRLLLSRGLKDAGCCRVHVFTNTTFNDSHTFCHSASQHRPTTGACCQLVCQCQPSALLVLKFEVLWFLQLQTAQQLVG